MNEEGVERRLTTILAADVVGYSRLMAADEVGTLTSLKAHRRELIEPKTVEYHGRVVKLMGDSTLMEFTSVVDAVNFAVDVQRAMVERNAGAAEDRQITYRFGINIGDIIVEGEDIYGDGVNIAARLEGLAEPGGICVARNVFNQVNGKVDLGFEDLGEREVKNIPNPVQVFKVLLHASASVQISGAATLTKNFWRWPAITGFLVILAVASGVVLWQRPWEPREEPASEANMAFPLPDKPSIAVLPFTNMSDDPEQEYFADGMAEDIITDLSKIAGLLVIARNSSFAYKGQSPDIREVGRDLGVGFVLEGSVRRAGGRIRINVQLVDAATAHHVWAERYDREAKAIFDLQDEVRGKVVAALEVQLTPDEEARLARRLTNSPEAYDLWLRGLRQESFFTKDANLESRHLFEQAVEIDPGFAAAYASLGTAYYLALQLGRREKREEFAKTGLRLIEKAVELNDELPRAYWALAFATSRRETFDGDRALAALEKAIAIDPNYADAYGLLATVKNNMGRAEEALGHIEQAMRLNPRFPFWYIYEVGKSQFMLTHFDAAAESLEKAVEKNPNVPWTRRFLVATYGHLGRIEDAEWELEELRVRGNEPSLTQLEELSPIQDPLYRERYIEGLRKAGVPEK